MKIKILSYWRREDGFVGTTAALVTAGIAVAGAVTSAIGAYSQGQSQKAAAEFNSQVANNNAKAIQEQSMADAAQIMNRSRRMKAAQISAMTAAGVDAGSSSGQDVVYDSQVQGELSRLTTLYKGKIGANVQSSQAELDTMQGQSAQTASYWNAGGTLLSGAGSAAYDYSSIANNPRFAGQQQYDD